MTETDNFDHKDIYGYVDDAWDQRLFGVDNSTSCNGDESERRPVPSCNQKYTASQLEDMRDDCIFLYPLDNLGRVMLPENEGADKSRAGHQTSFQPNKINSCDRSSKNDVWSCKAQKSTKLKSSKTYTWSDCSEACRKLSKQGITADCFPSDNEFQEVGLVLDLSFVISREEALPFQEPVVHESKLLTSDEETSEEFDPAMFLHFWGMDRELILSHLAAHEAKLSAAAASYKENIQSAAEIKLELMCINRFCVEHFHSVTTKAWGRYLVESEEFVAVKESAGEEIVQMKRLVDSMWHGFREHSAKCEAVVNNILMAYKDQSAVSSILAECAERRDDDVAKIFDDIVTNYSDSSDED